MEQVKTDKKKRDNKDWDRSDLRFRLFLNECQPQFATQMTDEESYRFWQQAMGYIYARYGIDLLKRFKDTDGLILKVRKSIVLHQIDIPIAMDSLFREWPIFKGMDGSNVSFRLNKILKMDARDTLLPAWK